ncbi:MAG: M15 family metallopeptidase [Armatimonadetes bacterium]|nr:M15 family metallopeptidase [Armatimonadota bacterium]
MKTPTTYAQTVALFGNPAKSDGTLNKQWERDNIVSMKIPAGYPMFYLGTKVRTIRIHKLLAPDLQQIFTEIWDATRIIVKQERGYGYSTAWYDNRTREKLHDLGLDQFSGSYNFRPVRGGTQLSSHAFGIAIDIDAVHNPQGTKGRMPAFVVDIFERHGWQWGGRWRRIDPQHMQFRKE